MAEMMDKSELTDTEVPVEETDYGIPEADHVDLEEFGGPTHRCTITTEGLKEITKRLVPKYYTIYVHVITVVFLALSGASFYLGGWELGVIFVFGAVILQVILAFQKRRIMSLNRKKIMETAGSDRLDYSYRFGETAVHVYNETTGARADLKYTVIKKLLYTQNYVTITTYGRQYLPLDKRVEGAAEAINYLEEHL